MRGPLGRASIVGGQACLAVASTTIWQAAECAFEIMIPTLAADGWSLRSNAIVL
jgi:hypothetical protein